MGRGPGLVLLWLWVLAGCSSEPCPGGDFVEIESGGFLDTASGPLPEMPFGAGLSLEYRPEGVPPRVTVVERDSDDVVADVETHLGDGPAVLPIGDTRYEVELLERCVNCESGDSVRGVLHLGFSKRTRYDLCITPLDEPEA